MSECQNCGCLESSHPIIPTKIGGNYCGNFIQATTPSTVSDVERLREGLEYCKQMAKALENNSLEPDKVIALAGQISYRASVALATTPSIEYGKIPIPTPVIEYNEKVGILAELEQLQKEKEELEREVEELEDELNTIREQIKGPSLHPEVTGVAVIDDIRDMQRDCNRLTKKVSTQSSQIKELVAFVQRIANDASSTMSFEMIECEAKQALARFKEHNP